MATIEVKINPGEDEPWRVKMTAGPGGSSVIFLTCPGCFATVLEQNKDSHIKWHDDLSKFLLALARHYG